MNEKERILIVDDEELIRRHLELSFGEEGYEVETAETGREAMEKARDTFFNLVLLDMKLPDTEGVELIAPLKERHPDLAVVIITAFASKNSAIQALNEGAAAYITKPFEMDEVLAVAGKTLDEQRLVIENRRLNELCRLELAERRQAQEALQKAHYELEKQVEERTAELREANEAMRESEARFRNLMEHLPGVAVQGYGTDGRVFYWNKASEKVYGYGAEEAIGKNLGDLIIPPEMRPHFEEALALGKRVRGSGELRPPGELLLLHKKGHLVPVYSIHTAVLIDGKEPMIFCIDMDLSERKKTEEELRKARDEFEKQVEKRTAELRDLVETLSREIAERKAAEEALRESEERFRAIFDGAKDAIFLETLEGRILDVNKAACDMLGYTREELVSKSVGDIVPPEIATRLPETVQEKTVKWDVYVETEELKKDGMRIPVEVSNTLVEIGGEKRVVAIVRDISERIRTQEALRRSEEQYRALAEDSPDIIMRFDKALRHLYVNSAIARVTGTMKPEDFIGKTHREIGFPSDMCVFWEKQIEKVFDLGESHEVQFEMDFPTGRVVFEWLLIPEFAPDGTVETVLGISRDITKRKRAEEQLRHAQKMEAIGTLAGGLAHDFNNLLAGIIGYASLAKTTLDKKSPLFTDLESIERLSERGADLTRAMLAFSRRGDYHPESLSIHRVIEDVARIVGRTVGKGMSIEVDFSPGTSNVLGDSGQIHQLLMNLCINACEAMPMGGTLTVKAANAELDEGFFRVHPNLEEGEYVFVIVSDTGGGIDPGTRDRIFDPFFTTKADRTGTGLGLSVAIGVVENHGGCIEVQSEPGVGSTFTVYFPATKEAIGEVEPKPLGTLRGEETILIVDDEEDFRVSTGLWLKKLGYTVVEAASGEDALKVLEEIREKIDLVLLDMIMKGMGGDETFRRMRKIVPRISVIVCTGYSLSGAAQRVLEEGARAYIQKPFDYNSLALKIRQVLGA